MAKDPSVKKSKYSAARYVGSIKIEKVQQQFLEVLKREAKHLLDESHKAKLSADSSKNLMNYLKLIKDLDRSEREDPPKASVADAPEAELFTELSDEELKKMASKTKTGGQDV